MPIFEPTQIVPSSFTTSETIAVADNVSIQWQINGNSALTAFQIDMYQNTATSEFIYSTGKIGTGYALPFNGIDRYGRKQYFSYAPEQNWAAWSDNAMTDGNSYKYKITQWFAAVVQVGSIATTRSFSANTTYYFRVTNQSAYVAFTPTSTLASDMANATFYYDFTTLKGWYVNAGGRLVPVSMNVTTFAPSGTSIGATTSAASDEDWIQQVSESAIITRTTPTLALAITTGGSETEQNTLISSVAVFTGAYTQAQGVAVRSTHWVLRNESGDLLEDTGVIYTSVVEYMYSGFFNGESYTLSCTVETETGVQVTASIDFTVSYEGGTYYGEFNANCVPKEGSIYLQWEALRVISPTTSGEYTQGDGYVELPAGSSITWDKELEDAMNFQPPWFATWTGRVQTEEIKNPTSKTVTLTGTTGTEGEGETGLVTQKQVSGTANTYVDSYSPAPSYANTSGITSGGSSSGYMTRSVSGQTVARRDEDSEPFSFSGQATAHSATGVQPFSFSGTATPHFVGASGSSVQTTLTTSSTEIDPSTMMYSAMKIIPMSRYNVITSATVKSTTADKATAGKYDDTHIYVYAWTNEPGKTVSVTCSVSYNKYEYYATFSGVIDRNDASVTSVNVTSSSGTSSTVSKAGNTYSITVYSDGENTVSAEGTVDYTYTLYYSATAQGDLPYNITGYTITSQSSNVTNKMVQFEGTHYGWEATADSAGQTVSLTIRFSVSVNKTPSYSETRYFPNITSASIASVTSGTYATVTVNTSADTYTVTIYGSSVGQAVSARVQINTTYQIYKYETTEEFKDGTITAARLVGYSGTDGSVTFTPDSYTVSLQRYGTGSVNGTVELTYDGLTYEVTLNNPFTDGVITNATIISTTGSGANIEFTDADYTLTLYSHQPSDEVTAEVKFDYYYLTYNNIPQGKFWEIQGNNITFTRTGNIIYVGVGDAVQAVSFTPPTDCVLATFAVSPTTIYAYFFNAKGALTQNSAAVTYMQGAVTSVTIYGGTSGTTVYNVAVYEGDGSTVLPRLEDDGYEPTWGSPYYDLYLNANFNGNIEGGTGSALNNGFRIYREEVGTNVLVPIYTAGATETQLKDYGVVSGKSYTYYLYVYDNTNAFMQQKPLGYDVPFNLNKYTLIVADYDSASDTYHAIKEYIFRENASVGSISNNNTPTLSENFTGFPTRTKSVQNYKSGTLSSLIGTIYKRTDSDEESGANSGTLAYHDSVELEQELYDLSVSDYTLFLRDPKGHLFMVRTQSPIVQEVDYARMPMPISISLPWVETGDASDVSIIQAPTDIGWNYDNDVLKTRLRVNLDTGKLIAEYPPNYNSSTFYITGERDNKLAAETPQTVTPAEFTYSEEALDPHDGELTATATRLVDDGTQTAEADDGSGEGISDNGEKE